MPSPRVLCSLHDVTPFHQERIERAEALFGALGVRRVAYLLVPQYHGGHPADDPAFAAWCRRPRPFEVEWFLHGFYHQEREAPAGGSLGEQLKRRYATAGEGEFLALGPEQVRARLDAGAAVFERTLGAPPTGFVAPAWLYNEALPPALRAAGIRYYEDHHRVYDTATGRALRAPVVTWATRTPARKWSSVLGTPALRWWWRREPLLRLAVHPYDFDHPATERSIHRVWSAALAGREQAAYSECFPGAFAQAAGTAVA